MPDTPQPEPRPGRSSVVPLHPAAGDETPTVLGLNPNPTPPAEAFALPPGADAAALRRDLWARRVEIPVIERPDRTLLRVSHHFYTTEAEIDHLAAVLPRLL